MMDAKKLKRLKEMGGRVTTGAKFEPAARQSLLALLATLQPLDEELPPINELKVDPVDL